jgi:hypothetical protein
LKVKLEPQKTSLRLNKEEFQTLRQKNQLQEELLFPGGKRLNITVLLESIQFFSFEGDEMRFGLPNHIIQIYKPSKVGLSLKFQRGKDEFHTVIFEVDIKKPPLGAPAQ